jgi:hypothetical protein
MKKWNEQFWDLLDSYLPHHGSRIIIFLTLILSGALFAAVPLAVKLMQPPLKEASITLIQLTAPLSLLVCNAVLVYALNIRFIMSQTATEKSPFRFIGKAKIAINDYYEIPGFKTPPFRIELKKISIETIPSRYECIPESDLNNEKAETATLCFAPHLSMHHGRRIKKIYKNNIDEETYIMCKSQLPEQDASVFFFYISPEGK